MLMVGGTDSIVQKKNCLIKNEHCKNLFPDVMPNLIYD